MLISLKKKLTLEIVENIEKIIIGQHKSEYCSLQHKTLIAPSKARVVRVEMEKINDDIKVHMIS